LGQSLELVPDSDGTGTIWSIQQNPTPGDYL